MPRLIELADPAECPPALRVEPGDLVLVRASGGRVTGDAVRLLGPFVAAVVGTDGGVLAPAGGPNAVALLATGPGRARVELFAGGPWGAPRAVAVEVTVGG